MIINKDKYNNIIERYTLNNKENNNLMVNTEYKPITDDYYNYFIEDEEKRILKFKNKNTKVNVQLETDDYEVKKEGNAINIFNYLETKDERVKVENPYKDIMNNKIFTELEKVDDKDNLMRISKLFKKYKDDYKGISDIFKNNKTIF